VNKGDFNFAIMVNPISGNIFVDRLIEYRLRPTLVITHDPFYTPSKSSSMDKIRFVKTYTKYLLNKEQFHHQYYTFFKSRKYKIPTFPSQIVNTARCANLLKSLNLDYIFIFTFPIIRDFIFTIPKYGTINFHPSLLPKHRGADPEFWTIKNKDKYSGMTFHYIDKGNSVRPMSVRLLHKAICRDHGLSPPRLSLDLPHLFPFSGRERSYETSLPDICSIGLQQEQDK